MAITKLLRIKEANGSNKAAHLKKNLFYICNPEKTAGGIWIGGNAGCNPEIAYRTMIQNKEFWEKPGGSQAFHYMLSFPPDCGIGENIAYAITEEFCKELLSDDYYYVFAVHNDKAHLHSHITFDAVSKTDGYKFHSPKGDWQKRIQPITDRICEKYHISTLQYDDDKKHGTDYGEWKRKNQRQQAASMWEDSDTYYTWNDILRDDIDEAIRHAGTPDEFILYLKEMGYEVRSKKYLSLKAPGRQRAVRTGRLGDGYSKEDILKRIRNKKLEPEIAQRYKTYGNRQEIRNIVMQKMIRTPGWRMTPFQKQFYRRWNNTFFIRKPDRRNYAKNHKQDILEVQKLAAGLNYMIDYDIDTPEQLLERKELLSLEAEALRQKRAILRTQLYRSQPNPLLSKYEKLEKEFLRNPTGEIKNQMNTLRQQIEKKYSFEAAASQRERKKNEISECSRVIRDNKKELDLVEDILELYSGGRDTEQIQPAERIPEHNKTRGKSI